MLTDADFPAATHYNADETIESRQAFIERMKADGHTVRTPAANQLFLDIDSDAQYEHFTYALDILERNGIGPISYATIVSKGGLPGRHITVQLPFDVDTYARIAWQAALGSDPVREIISCVRASKGQVFPTLFVEPKVAIDETLPAVDFLA